MPSWRSLKPGSAHNDARRRSAIVDAQPARHSDQLVRHHDTIDESPQESPVDGKASQLGNGEQEQSKGTAAADKSIEDRDFQPRPRPPLAGTQTGSQRNNRFSLLKFRHASDPQLSTSYRTAAAAADAPPVPFLPRKLSHLVPLLISY